MPVTSVVGFVNVYSNDALTTLGGLAAMVSVGDDLKVWYNAALPQCEVCAVYDHLVGFAGDFVSSDNAPDVCVEGCGSAG